MIERQHWARALLALVLAAALVIGLAPVTAWAIDEDTPVTLELPGAETAFDAADAATANELKSQAASTYATALERTGRTSFYGNCAGLVNQTLYILGINTYVVGLSGKDEYDFYEDMEKSSGGYAIETYSAADYTLLEALNKLTNNGTQTVYNVLVGFEKGSGEAGAKYGHTCFIHGIVGGTIYYYESYNGTFGGVYYPEGSVISCTISQFASHYGKWAEFEGIVHFSGGSTTASNTGHSGWVKEDGAWYYYDSNGTAHTGWLKSGSTWYYLNSSGVMQTGWVKSGSAWYYLSASGAMQTGWVKLGSTWYYLSASGAMVTGTQTIGSTTYTFADSGAWIG